VLEGISTHVLDHGGSKHRLEMILSEEDLARVNFIPGDISDLAAVENALRRSQASNMIHLAALQMPACRADPSLGAQVNVVGTINAFEACKRIGIDKIAYSSSTAVYGPKHMYSDGPLRHDVPLYPTTHYGVYKQANEASARIYWDDDGLSSVGLRPYTVYGPGRDQGMTSSPTKAMIAAVIRRPYQITFGGRYGFEYADDVAKIFIKAARASYQGAHVFSIGGRPTHTEEIITAIESVEPSMRDKISYIDSPLPFPEEFDDAAIVSLLGEVPRTPLIDGIASTISIYQQEISNGRLNFDWLESVLGA
jgi:nucleoside-diphosphate-sugar epimerase